MTNACDSQFPSDKIPYIQGDTDGWIPLTCYSRLPDFISPRPFLANLPRVSSRPRSGSSSSKSARLKQGGAELFLDGISKALQAPKSRPRVAAESSSQGASKEQISSFIAHIRDLIFPRQQLAILFHDDLVIEHQGVAVGERIDTINLGPGESLSYTMKTTRVTKKSLAVSQLSSSESAFERTQSSTSAYHQSFEEQWTSEMSTRIGLDIGGEVQGAKVGMTTGQDTQDAHNKSSKMQRDISYETSQKTSNTMKRESSIQLQVEETSSEEAESVRVIKNPMPDRSMHMHVHRLYDIWHHQIVRRRIHLAIPICVRDPFALERGLFCAHLDSLVSLGFPAAGKQERTFVISRQVGGREVTPITFDLPYAKHLGGVSFALRRVWVFYHNRVDSDVVSENPATLTAAGGQVSVMLAPGTEIGSEGQVTVSVEVFWGDKGYAYPYQVEVTVVLDEVPSDAYYANYDTMIERMRGRLDGGYLREAHDSIVGKGQSVMSQALEQLGRWVDCDSCEGGDEVREAFCLEEATVDILPWFATSQGRENRALLRGRLMDLYRACRLAPSAAVSEVDSGPLVASLAVALIPIREGNEAMALRLMGTIADPQLLKELADTRATALGPLGQPWTVSAPAHGVHAEPVQGACRLPMEPD